MNRDDMLSALRSATKPWDFIIVGGGATGLGCAVDASSRGYRTLLLERGDFAKGTSSRSTKLVHGGVRYLRQGNISLVLEALRERGLLIKNAPHLVRNTAFVVPNYSWWEGPFYGIGLKMYDLLAGRSGFGRSKLLSRKKTLEMLPAIEPEGLDGGVIYYDGQFDDARLAVNLAQTAVERGGVMLNYVRVTGLIKKDGEVQGAFAHDEESGEEFEIPAKVVINATGVFTDEIRRMDNADAPPMVSPSQGVHIVLDKSFLPGNVAIMVPKTDDGRVLFAIPWHGVVLVGTTDTPVKSASLEPRPLAEELAFLLDHAGRYLVKNPTADDVLSTFAGLRPLVSGGNEEGSTAELARDHSLVISKTGLVTITGGKWTTYRKMAEDTIDQAAVLADLPERPCVTRELPVHGLHHDAESLGDLAYYGSDAAAIRRLISRNPAYAERLHERFSATVAQVVWAVRQEMARTVEDVLSRRTRSLLLDARASMEMAPRVASVMAEELGRDETWIAAQVESYTALAQGYLIPASSDNAAGRR
ncbi:MAG: glycerol-3-phosphate dehydrogenase/oxidase [Planctomycetota bacterium]|nr:glycerol-3-phosphate dehydrogenase/oxidase [Planctomycetaceae bacterium]MDQ3329109.1 glycerol-3-phosphate dehydrogenase/oxidase [Planctomycetota bacterium]